MVLYWLNWAFIKHVSFCFLFVFRRFANLICAFVFESACSVQCKYVSIHVCNLLFILRMVEWHIHAFASFLLPSKVPCSIFSLMNFIVKWRYCRCMLIMLSNMGAQWNFILVKLLRCYWYFLTLHLHLVG